MIEAGSSPRPACDPVVQLQQRDARHAAAGAGSPRPTARTYSPTSTERVRRDADLRGDVDAVGRAEFGQHAAEVRFRLPLPVARRGVEPVRSRPRSRGARWRAGRPRRRRSSARTPARPRTRRPTRGARSGRACGRSWPGPPPPSNARITRCCRARRTRGPTSSASSRSCSSLNGSVAPASRPASRISRTSLRCWASFASGVKSPSIIFRPFVSIAREYAAPLRRISSTAAGSRPHRRANASPSASTARFSPSTRFTTSFVRAPLPHGPTWNHSRREQPEQRLAPAEHVRRRRRRSRPLRRPAHRGSTR